MDAHPVLASDRPDPEFLRPGQARRRLGRGGQQAPGAVPGLPAAGRRDVGRQLPRPAPRRPGPAGLARAGRLLARRAVDAGRRARLPRRRLRPTRCRRAWPTTPTTRSSASWAGAAWASSTWPRTSSWAATEVLKVVSGHLIEPPRRPRPLPPRDPHRRPGSTTPTSSPPTRPSASARASSSRWSTSRASTWPSWSRPRGRCRWPTPATSSTRRRWACSTPTSTAWSTATSSRAT